MMISRSTYSAAPLAPSPFREAEAVRTFEPTLRQSLGANLEQGYTEMGAIPIFEGLAISNLEQTGTPISEEDYKKSEFYRPQLGYYQGMTKESAEALANRLDDKVLNQRIIDNANTVGIGTTAYIAGMVAEPINALSAVATMGVSNAVLATKMGVHLSRVSRIGARAGAFGVEGMAGAVLAEPFNRYGASVVYEDYTMADSALNIVSNTILSAGLGTAGHFLSERAKVRGIQKAFDEAKAEMDVATKQLLVGQEVDVNAVRAVNEGDILKKSVDQKAAIAEEFVRYTETPEFQARFAGSKVVDAEGKPLRVYHGTTKDFDQFDYTKKDSGGGAVYGVGNYFAIDPKLAGEFATRTGEGGNIRPAYINLKNPYISNANDFRMRFSGVEKAEITNQLKAQGFDGVIITRGDDLRNAEVIAYEPDQIISAFGADDLDNITARIAKQNSETVKASTIKANDPANSTAYDSESIREVEDYRKTYPDEKTQEQLMQYEEEITAMKEQGLLSDEDLQALEYINSFKEEDVMAAYESLYICLTRG